MGFHSRHEPIQPRERFTVNGAVILTIPQLALLQSLMDRPGCRARSRTDWAEASKPYVTLFRAYNWDAMMLQAYRIPREWVSRARVGSRIECQLTDRGRDILERRVPAHIYGYGPYWGLRLLVSRGVR
jgi:hypothetical protein